MNLTFNNDEKDRLKPQFKRIALLNERFISNYVFLNSSNEDPLFNPRLADIQENFIRPFSTSFSADRYVNWSRLLLLLQLSNQKKFLSIVVVAKVSSGEGHSRWSLSAVLVQVWPEVNHETEAALIEDLIYQCGSRCEVEGSVRSL